MPPKADDDRTLLDALMAEEGVTPRRDRGPTAPAKARQTAAPPSPAPAPARAPAPAPAPARDEERARLQTEVERLRADLAEAEARTRTVTEERDAFDVERRALGRKVSALQQQAPTPTPSTGVVDDLLTRGVPPERHAEALATLLLELPTPALAALEGGDLPGLLDQRLLLLCDGDACRLATEHAAVLPVDPPACEVCGGSDMAAAWHRFATACAARGHATVVIVGGSPNYRRQLRELCDAHPTDLRLELIDGREKPRTRRIKTMARQADLVVAWCATIVDHATTNAFQASGAAMVQVPHRGIARMLGWLADWLEGPA